MEATRKKIDPHITWAGDYCKHCFTCINICPVKNLKFEGDEMVSLGKCIHCQLCEKYCPDYAIEADPKKAVTKAAGSAEAKNAGEAVSEAKTKKSVAKALAKSAGQNKAGETK